jgi:hypothetical protein
MANLIMGHGVSERFGTRLAPKNEAGTRRKAAPTPPLARRGRITPLGLNTQMRRDREPEG